MVEGSAHAPTGGHRLILASTSRYRAELLAQRGVEFDQIAPDFDERSLDHRFGDLDPGGFAVLLATGKAASVCGALPGGVVVAADQIAVLADGSERRLLHQAPDVESAVAQLCSMSGRTHQLINGVVLMDVATEERRTAVDLNVVTMADFDSATARRYVEEFEPFDCVGSYRIEDDAGLIESVQAEHISGIVGLPIPTLERLIALIPSWWGADRPTGGTPSTR